MDSLVGAAAGLAGVHCITAFAQSSRVGYSGQIGKAFGVLMIPMFGALMVPLAFSVGWWSLLIFVVGSLTAGASNSMLLRSSGQTAVINAQPARALITTFSTTLLWALHLNN
jgi:hypothetical protein